jgi:O-antigen ligase
LLFDLLIIGMMYFAAFAWGSNEPWAKGLIILAVITILAARLIWDIWHEGVKIGREWFYAPVILLLVGITIGLATQKSDSKDWQFFGSVEHYSTTMYLLLALSYVALVFLAANGFRSRGQVKLLVIAVLILGAFEAAYGLVQYLSNHDYIWQFSKKYDKGLATGTFINRNHYALLLNLCFCTGVGYLYYRSSSILAGFKFSWRKAMAIPGAAKLVWILFWLALMGLGVFFSLSRMGIVAMIAGLVSMIIASKLTESGKRTIVIGFVLIALILGLSVYIGMDAVLARYESLSKERESDTDRIAHWRDAWKMIEKHPVFGQGLGTFEWTFPAYESVDPDIPAKYAHNDYLQMLAEVGAVGLGLLVWAFGTVWWAALKNLRNAQDPLARGIGLGTIGALTAIALQEITDFGLYIPGIAVVAAVLVGLNLRARSLAKS